MAIHTTVEYLINGDVVDIEGNEATIVEINYLREPLVRLSVRTERFGIVSVVTTDTAPITILKRGE